MDPGWKKSGQILIFSKEDDVSLISLPKKTSNKKKLRQNCKIRTLFQRSHRGVVLKIKSV